jgi:hypothetical protein
MVRRRPIIIPPETGSVAEAGRDNALCDLRFRALLGAAAWARLPAAVRARFSKRLQPGLAITYAGRIIHSRRTWAGRILAGLARAIGAPLPLHDDLGMAAVVTVTEDAASGGQFWMRQYDRERGFPQVIHSSKRFAGPTGLEEYLGAGFGIALTVSADEQALHFHSDHYFVQFGRLRLRLPRFLSPGALTISHVDFGADWFAFVLVLENPLAGVIVSQTGIFRERPIC